MKDPAFLFYTKDFMDGALGLTMEERGQYITLICMQHQRGVLTLREIEVAVPGVSKYVMKKFIADQDGNYFNERLKTESEKRKNFCESRRKNRVKKNTSSTYVKHMIDTSSDKSDHMSIHMVNANVNVNTDVDEGENTNAKIHVEVIEHLNSGAGRKFEIVPSNTKHITARIKEGATTQDMKDVIEYQCAEWIGTDFEKFLRPSTLFNSSKYQNYIENVRFNKSKGISAAQIWRGRKPKSEADSGLAMLEALEKHRAAN